MLLDTFETLKDSDPLRAEARVESYAQGLLYNSNFKESAGAGLQAYRGDLVLIEGEVADAMGRRKPPIATAVGAVLLADESQIKFLAGSLDDIAHIEPLIEKYAPYFAAGMGALLYVVNIDVPMQVETAGTRFVLLPLADGLAWNELVDELRLEKSDFKGQSSGEKIATVYKAWQDYKPKCESVSLDVALGRATQARRAIYGAV